MADYRVDPAYSELERLVIRYAEELTSKLHVEKGIHEELRSYLPDHELVELCVTVATANFTNRITHALSLDIERSRHKSDRP
ncbi:MAG: carboxymuconolactone decarboxylase family protein [Candidatus Methylomirabilia bacterium]